MKRLLLILAAIVATGGIAATPAVAGLRFGFLSPQ
jgi:hypothetical protein